MMAPSYATIVEMLFTEIDLLLANYVFNAYSAFAHYLKLPLGLASTLYIILLGLSISQGWIELSMRALLKSASKLALIYSAAMSWGWFSYYVVNFISLGAGQLGNILVTATPIPIPHFSGSGINGAMQSVLIEFTKIGVWIWDMGSWRNLGPCFTAVIIWGFGYALILIAIFELILAKIMLAILFALAPLFVAFTLFRVTHGFFDRWIGACVGFAFLMIFIASVVSLNLSVAQWAIAGIYAERAIHISLVGFVPVMIIGFIGVGVVLKAAQLSQNIGGTISTLSATSSWAPNIGGMISHAFSK